MIGDVLTSSILFEALRKKYPESELHYLIQPHTTPVVLNNPFIDRVIEYDPKINRNPLAFISFFRQLKKQKYDVVIDVYSKISTALLSYFSKAQTRISYEKWYIFFLYTHNFNYRKKLVTTAGFAIENRMQLLQALNKDFPLELKPKLFLSTSEKEAALLRIREEGISAGRPLFMIGVLGSIEKKTYPLPYMAKLLDYLVDHTGARLLFNYIPNQKPQIEELFSYCNANTQKHISLHLYGKNLRDFMALTSHCDALIGNEGGAVNIAKALNIPTFSIFSPQIDKKNWALFEDDLNMAVHLQDFKPELFNDNSTVQKRYKLYNNLTPELIWPDLKQFIKNLQLK